MEERCFNLSVLPNFVSWNSISIESASHFYLVYSFNNKIRNFSHAPKLLPLVRACCLNSARRAPVKINYQDLAWSTDFKGSDFHLSFVALRMFSLSPSHFFVPFVVHGCCAVAIFLLTSPRDNIPRFIFLLSIWKKMTKRIAKKSGKWGNELHFPLRLSTLTQLFPFMVQHNIKNLHTFHYSNKTSVSPVRANLSLIMTAGLQKDCYADYISFYMALIKKNLSRFFNLCWRSPFISALKYWGS
jgi:hypothetical protein